MSSRLSGTFYSRLIGEVGAETNVITENLHKEISRYTKLIVEKMSEADILAQSPHYPLDDPTIVQLEDLKVKHKPRSISAANDAKNMKSVYEEFFAGSEKTSTQVSASNEEVNIADTLKKYLGFDIKVKASNNWAIHGNRTLSGKPLLCNDPHLGFEVSKVIITEHPS